MRPFLSSVVLVLTWAALGACQAQGGSASAPTPGPEQAAAATVIGVSTAPELLQALAQAADVAGPAKVRVDLQQDIALSPNDTQPYSLPFVVGSKGRNLTLELVASGPIRSLDFGGTPELLYLSTGCTLLLRNLNLSNPARKGIFATNFEDGSPGYKLKAPTAAAAFNLYPTVNFAPNTTAIIRGVNLTLAPNKQCTEQIVAQQVATFQQMTGDVGTAWASGTTVHIVRLAAPLPVFNASDMQQQVGVVNMNSQGTNSTCLPEPSAASEAGGGTPSWVWAIVGSVAGVALLAALAGAFVWRRWAARLHPKSAANDSADPESGCQQGGSSAFSPATAEVLVGTPGGSDSKASKASSGTGQGTERRSSMEKQPSGELDAMWKTSRVGFIAGLSVGQGVLGGGGFGKVFLGKWKGVSVAVKVVPTHVCESGQIDLGREPLLSMSLSHPNVLPSYKACVVRVLQQQGCEGPPGGPGTSGSAFGSGSGPGSGSNASKVVPSLVDRNALVEVMPSTAVLEPGLYEMWLVSEYADKGSLAAAIKSGWFKTPSGGRDMLAIMCCLLDICRGLEYLHTCNIVHGDLKPQNVLLKREKQDRRGYVAKLADFGLSRMLREHQTHVSTGNYGTATHAAPELMLEGHLTKASDIYALGIVIWEMVSGQPIFHHVPLLQIVSLVTLQHYRPPIPDDCPQPLADLIRSCWSDDPDARPDATAVLLALKDCAPAVIAGTS